MTIPCYQAPHCYQAPAPCYQAIRPVIQHGTVIKHALPSTKKLDCTHRPTQLAEYFTSDLEHPMSADDVRESDRDTQLDVMETWFRQRFEDPAERTPYESAEGGYIWIHGGPYDAREELEPEFSGIVPDELINELADDLERECWQWAPTPSPEDYDEYLVQDSSVRTLVE